MKLQRNALAAALAAALAVPALGFAAAADLPIEKTQGAVTYLSGGNDRDEIRAIEKAAQQWPLELEFLIKAKPHDESAANVKVMIRDAEDRTVLDTTADGPFLLAKLAPGEYVVTADHNGRKLERHVIVWRNRHHSEMFIWAS